MRLTNEAMEEIFEAMKLPEAGRELVREIRAGQPARRVNRASSVTGNFPSAKMGLTIQYESRAGEGVACTMYEGSAAVLEFYDQPKTFSDIPYQPLGTERRFIEHTPDFLVIRRSETEGRVSYEIAFEEWRERERLERLSEGDPKRWLKLLDGNFTQLPVEEYLRPLGIGYRVRVIDDAPSVLVRNVDLLSDFYLSPQPLVGEMLDATRAAVSAKPGLSFAALLREVPGLTVDHVLGAIASGQLYTNLEHALLVEHESVRLYLDAAAQALFVGAPKFVERGEVTLVPGARLRWGERDMELLNVTETHVYLGGPGGEQKIARQAFEQWIADGDIVGITDARASLADTLLEHGPQAMSRAQERLRIITPYLKGDAYPQERSHQRWLAAYRRAEELQGDGIAGLLADTVERGNRDARLIEETEDRAARAIRTYLLQPAQISVRRAHALFKSECEEAGVPAMALSSFHARYRVLSQAERLRARVGEKAANAAAMRSQPSALPRHGDYAMSRVHIDHTTLDLECVDSATGENLGRPEVTLVVDAFTRKILVALALYQHPRGSTDLLALRELIKRHHRWPTALVVDGGSDFGSTVTTDLAEAYRVKIEHRRTGHARDGGPGEAAFKKLDTDLIWTLRGNTQIRKDVRAMGREHDPSKLAVWTLAALQEELDRWAELYNATVVPTLGASPNDLFARSIAAAGARDMRYQTYSPSFRALSAPTPRSGATAKVGREGVRIHNIIYWCNALQLPGVEGTSVAVRYEPLDARVAYVQVKNVWHIAEAKYRELEGRTDREVIAASQELRRRLGKEPSTRELATHLRRVHERQEQLTKEQQRRVRKRAEQHAVTASREPAVAEEPAPEAEANSASDATPATEVLDEVELGGYEAHSEDEMQEKLSQITKEAA